MGFAYLFNVLIKSSCHLFLGARDLFFDGMIIALFGVENRVVSRFNR
jgi:hypothetical protein